jgi:GNAT superfamily N-acetyltransferase
MGMDEGQEADAPLPPAGNPPTTPFPWFTPSILLPRGSMGRMKPVEIRAPRSDEARALARLKIEWAQVDPRPDAAAVWKYADDLAAWMDRMGDRVVCRVAAVGDDLVGMCWLVLYERMPDFEARKGKGGIVQSLYVLPSKRGRGIGIALVQALCAVADERGIPRVSVRATGGTAVWEAAGFRGSARLLDREGPAPQG